MEKSQRLTSDPATADMLEYVKDKDMDLVWDRFEKQQPQCGFGDLGLCCRICSMGPCRVDPFGKVATVEIEGGEGRVASVEAARRAGKNPPTRPITTEKTIP